MGCFPTELPLLPLTVLLLALHSTSTSDGNPYVDEAGSDFEGYDYTIIHEEILKDRNRTNAYRDAILRNSEFFQNKIVADLGCGLGLMSLLSAKAGAKKVYCIESAAIADVTRKIVAANGLSGVIHVIKERMESVEIPEGYVDIIVSEWMGFFLLFEDMLPDVITFRDKYLTKHNGLIMPSEARLWGALYHDDHWYWQDVYGFDYTPILEKVKSEQFENPERMHLRSNGLISTPSLLFNLDLYTTSIEDLFVTKNEKLALVFTVYLDLLMT
eukprot:jgi/Bigna1/66407/fgenesh1_pg.1_\